MPGVTQEFAMAGSAVKFVGLVKSCGAAVSLLTLVSGMNTAVWFVVVALR
jgi:hypothetical protein